MKKGDTVVKYLAVLALGGVLGWYVIPMLVGKGGHVAAQAVRQPTGAPPIHRIAGDTINTCDQLRPVLRQIQQDSADGDLSLADLTRIYQQVQRIA